MRDNRLLLDSDNQVTLKQLSMLNFVWTYSVCRWLLLLFHYMFKLKTGQYPCIFLLNSAQC